MQSIIQPVKGEACTYIVQSSRNPKEAYKVDLLANYGNGECSCKDFEIRRRPNAMPAIEWLNMHSHAITPNNIDAIKESMPETCKRLQTHHTMCKHIIMARNKWVNDTLQLLAIQEKQHLQDE